MRERDRRPLGSNKPAVKLGHQVGVYVQTDCPPCCFLRFARGLETILPFDRPALSLFAPLEFSIRKCLKVPLELRPEHGDAQVSQQTRQVQAWHVLPRGETQFGVGSLNVPF